MRRDGARRLLALSRDGFETGVDVHIFYHNQVRRAARVRGVTAQLCMTGEARVGHGPVFSGNARSLRQALNGEAAHYNDG